MSAVEYQFASTISVQAELARSYPLEAHIVSNIDAESYPVASDALFQFSEKLDELPPHDLNPLVADGTGIPEG